MPWSRKRQPTPVFLPGKFHEQSSLAGYCPWSGKQLDMTELTSMAKMGRTGVIIHISSCYDNDQMVKKFANSQTILSVEIKIKKHELKNIHVSTSTDTFKSNDSRSLSRSLPQGLPLLSRPSGYWFHL